MALATLSAWLAFVALMAAAMWLYPGGTWLDRSAQGHHFFANFLCDLTQPISLSGANNRLGASLAQAGMLCFAGALAGFFWLLPQHFRLGARIGSWVRGVGECAVLGVIAVPLTPSERFGHFHGLLALGSGGLGILAALLGVLGLIRSGTSVSGSVGARWLGWLGALTLAVGAFDAMLFAYHLSDSAPTPLLVPAAQKVAAVLLSVWMLAVVYPLLRSSRTLSVTRRP
jgi:hypothetical protein